MAAVPVELDIPISETADLFTDFYHKIYPCILFIFSVRARHTLVIDCMCVSECMCMFFAVGRKPLDL